MDMTILKTEQYDMAKPFLSDISGALWHLEYMKNSNQGKLIVDNFPAIDTVYLETPFSFYYFAGKYNHAFMDELIKHIIKDLIPMGETRPLLIFSSNQEWKDELEKYLAPYINAQMGAFLVRRLHHLDHEKYSKIRETIAAPADADYVYESKIEKDGSMGIFVKYHGVEIGNYCAGSPGLGYMDFDVFTKPEHRNKGLALFCCSQLIDYCINNNLIPQWGAATVNIPSCKLAERLGFKMVSETTHNFALITRKPVQ